MPPFHWGIRVKNHSDELILTEDLRGSLWTGGDKLPQRSFNVTHFLTNRFHFAASQLNYEIYQKQPLI